jgi:hypothetical protein
MALKVKLIIVPTSPNDLPEAFLGSPRPLFVEREIREILVPYLKRVLPESFGIGYNRGITSARAFFFLTVGHMSQCIVICPSCGGEILSDNEMRRTPRGRVVCDECAQDSYIDVPLA